VGNWAEKKGRKKKQKGGGGKRTKANSPFCPLGLVVAVSVTTERRRRSLLPPFLPAADGWSCKAKIKCWMNKKVDEKRCKMESAKDVGGGGGDRLILVFFSS
jgi:hypothetical protein